MASKIADFQNITDKNSGIVSFTAFKNGMTLTVENRTILGIVECIKG